MAIITTKWPALAIVGKSVTSEQADDILLRTWGGYFYSNDDPWMQAVGAIMGIEHKGFRQFDYQSEAACYKRLGGIDLHYLGNERIMAARLGGPFGWCDWDGKIGCNSYNIGKWPSVDEVEEDLRAIAAAWPFLDFRMQLFDGEGEGPLCGEWRVWDGKAMETEPGDAIAQQGFDAPAAVDQLLFGSGRERGVSPERLRLAYQRVIASRS